MILLGISPKQNKVIGQITKDKCMIKHSAKDIKKFADVVWLKKKWERGMPTGQITKAYQKKLECAKGQGHRIAAKKYWKEQKKEFFRYAKYKLKWGDCTHSGPVEDCIQGAASTYGASESWMLNVSYCESTWNQYAQNPSGSSGLFQFLPSTWETTPYGSNDIWSIKWQSLAAAWMYVEGRSGEWVCSG